MGDFEEIKKKYPIGGRPRSFNNPDEMLNKIYEFLEKQTNRTAEVAVKDGVREVAYPAPITIEGFCAFAGITKTTFYDYARRPKFKAIAQQFKQIVESYFVEQCVEGKPGNKADFVLKNAFGDEWKDKKDVELTGGVKGINVSFISKGNTDGASGNG